MAKVKRAATETAGMVVFTGKTAILILTLLLAAGVIYLVADWLRETILVGSIADGGEWAALLGGGFATWAFFLIRSGVIEQALGLWPKAKAVLASLRVPSWPPFASSLGEFTRAMALPGIVTVFALVFVGEGVGDQIKIITDPKPEPPLDDADQVSEIGKGFDSRLKRIEEKLGSVDLRAALDGQGYTADRAILLEKLRELQGGISDYGPDYYFARFPVSFERADLDTAGVSLVTGVAAASVRNPELIEEVARALLPCGSTDGTDPVIIRVEGYASSERFGTRDESDVWNVRTANARRRTVAQMLRQEIQQEDQERVVVCESADYVSLDEMEQAREFNDRPGGSRFGDQYLLTRSAHIKVLHPGMCKVGEERQDGEIPRLTQGASKCLKKELARLGQG